jgi:AhpC/TSA family
MKALRLLTLVLIGLPVAALGQSNQSPLAPPKIPPPSAGGKSTTLKLGDKAPDFGLPNGDGKLVILSEYTQRSPVVLVFYRGFW